MSPTADVPVEEGGEVAVVDLRSDTVTRPTEAMRRAIYEAEVGDDQLGDDPTTRRLEEVAAELLGKDAALYFPSGMMANQTALAILGGWGGEIVCEAGAHVFHYEDAAAAALAGVQLRPVSTPDGILTADLVRPALRPASRYLPRSRAVALENTHLGSGGRVVPPEVVAGVGELARERGLSVHLDGARLWHACAEEGLEPTAWTDHVDTVMVDLSKGLGCPVGSLLAGPEDFMEEAWRVRRRLGGSMRQSGLLAAAGLHALEHHRVGLVEDHRRARELAQAFDGLEGLRAPRPETNIVMVDVDDERVDIAELLGFLEKHGILMLPYGEARVRAVTHRDVGDVDLRRAIEVLSRFPEERAP